MALPKIVLDTNALIRCVSKRSPFAAVLDYLYTEKYVLHITTEILLEYEEKIAEIFDGETAESVIGIFSLLENVAYTEIFFNLNIITTDTDDNKFVDCAFAANANYLVTNDRHFNVLRYLSFPSINVITLEEFKELLTEM